jgi:hypothetical protein
MSKRYGRNQKRRHLAEVERLNQAYSMTDGLLKKIYSDLSDAKSTIAEMLEIIESVCKNSIAIPPKKQDGTWMIDRYRLERARDIDFTAVIGDDPYPSNLSFRTINLYALRVFLRENREQFSAAVHLEYSAGPHSAYMISFDGLRSMPREVLVRRFSPDIARSLIDCLRGK